MDKVERARHRARLRNLTMDELQDYRERISEHLDAILAIPEHEWDVFEDAMQLARDCSAEVARRMPWY